LLKGSYPENVVSGFLFTEHSEVVLMAGRSYSKEIGRKVKDLEHEVASLKRVGAELREREKTYHELLEDMPALICRFLPDGTLTLVNDRYCEYFQKRKEDLIGQNFFQFVPEEDRQTVREQFMSLSEENPMTTYEHQVIAPDGTIRWQQWTDRVLFDEQGEAKEYQSLGIDITERVFAEEAVKASEKKYRHLVENIKDVIFAVDLDGKLTFVSPSIESLIQYRPSEVIGRHFDEFIYGEDLPHLYENFQRILSGNTAANDYRIVTKYGHVRWMRTSSQPIYTEDRITGVQGTLSDITDQKHTELELKNSEKRYRSLVENSPIGIYYNDFSGKFLYGNKKAEEIVGYDSEELIGKNFLEVNILDAGDLSKALELLDMNRLGKGTGPDEFTLNTKDGSKVNVEINTEVISVDGDKAVLGMVRDITKRRQAEEALRDSEEKYRLLVENSSDAIFIVQDEQIKFPNQKAREMSEYLGLELDRVSFSDYIHPDDREKVLHRHTRRLHGEEVPSTYSFRLVSKEGQEFWVELSSVLVTWEGQPATLCFLKDITTQKALESQLQHVRRMEALGTLAGGIAHDFNNLLMAIQGRTSLMLLDLDSSHPYYEELKEMEKIVESGANLTKQLLGFARGGKYEPKLTNLNNLVQRSSEMFGRTRKEIKIHTAFEQSVWLVEIDQGQIEQVLLNLYVNAWQAMPEGGDLYLQTANLTLDEDRVGYHQMRSGKYVKISVADNGVGMGEETLQRIFDPFFTTKEIARGTGLGLASAYGIIKNHGGIIEVRSEKGKGTTFDILLPASEKGFPEEKEVKTVFLKGKETVLLVDDEEDVVRVTEKLLRRIGHRVLVAKNGKEAIEIYGRNKDRIDIVILDMIMPVISGGEAFDRLKEINPNVRVLLSTGYSLEGEASEILSRGCGGFIQKPYRINVLAQKIREVLDKS
jgi:two-component system cell cycle sensor histidine kinase/response regulator CckA